MSTAGQIKTIHVLKGQAGLDDDDYRALLLRRGVRSSKDLSDEAAIGLIDDLRRLPGTRAPASRATGRFAPTLQALWITAFNLALVRSRDDRAMMRFVERQTGLVHTRFLVDAVDAGKAIEGLKAWIARDGGVAWPKGGLDVERKEAVVKAIARRLAEHGALEPPHPGGGGLGPQPAQQDGEASAGGDVWPVAVQRYAWSLGLPQDMTLYSGREWDRLANALGAELRVRKARKARKAVTAGRAAA